MSLSLSDENKWGSPPLFLYSLAYSFTDSDINALDKSADVIRDSVAVATAIVDSNLIKCIIQSGPESRTVIQLD